jgi:hypothetical protein
MEGRNVYAVAGLIAIAIGVAVVLAMFAKPLSALPSQTNDGQATYSSQANGVSFSYPDTYKLEERTDGFEGKTIKIITLIDKNVVIPDMSEGPPVISLIIVPNPEGLALDEWIRTKSISNYQLSSMGEMGASTVGDESGLGYTYNGLYNNTAIAVVHKGNIYLFTVGTLNPGDQIKTDYFNLLDTVKFL